MVAIVEHKKIKNALSASFEVSGDLLEATAREALKTLPSETIASVRDSFRREVKNRLQSVIYRGIIVDLPDMRDKTLQKGADPFGPHKVSRFFVPAGRGTVENQVRQLLSKDEVESLTSVFNLQGALRGLSELAYFWNSNNKARNRELASLEDKTTQQQDFDATGYAFGNDRVAVLFCAKLVSRAREFKLDLTKTHDHWENYQAEIFNEFSEAEREVLSQLKYGVISTSSGELTLDDAGCLKALRPKGNSRSRRMAFGSPA